MSVLIGGGDTVVTPVTVKLTENGKPISVKFSAVFKRQDRDALHGHMNQIDDCNSRARELSLKKAAIYDTGESDSKENKKKLKALQAEIDELSRETEKLIRTNLIDVKGLKIQDGSIAEYSDTLVDELIGHPAYFLELEKALFSSTGARVKNL